MKPWILPTLAVAAVVFLMSRPGRELQEKIADNCGDWADNLMRTTGRLQSSLNQVQHIVDRFSRNLQSVSD